MHTRKRGKHTECVENIQFSTHILLLICFERFSRFIHIQQLLTGTTAAFPFCTRYMFLYFLHTRKHRKHPECVESIVFSTRILMLLIHFILSHSLSFQTFAVLPHLHTFASLQVTDAADQGCGVGRFFRIPTPDSDSSSFEKPTPTPDSDSSSFEKPTQTPDSDSSSFEKPTQTPAFLKTRLRLQQFKKTTPTPDENMRLHRLRLHHPSCHSCGCCYLPIANKHLLPFQLALFVLSLINNIHFINKTM